jgi:hypothetical protein
MAESAEKRSYTTIHLGMCHSHRNLQHPARRAWWRPWRARGRAVPGTQERDAPHRAAPGLPRMYRRPTRPPPRPSEGSGPRCSRPHRRQQWRPGDTTRERGSSTRATEKDTAGQLRGRRDWALLPYREPPQVPVTTGTSLTTSCHDSPYSTDCHSPLPASAMRIRLQHGIASWQAGTP